MKVESSGVTSITLLQNMWESLERHTAQHILMTAYLCLPFVHLSALLCYTAFSSELRTAKY